MDAKKALQELAAMIKSEIMNRVWEEGVNPKTGTNTLISSDLIQTMKVEAVSENEIVFQIADYWEYVVLGWRRTHRFEGTFTQFINNILKWMQKKNVHSPNIKDNNLAWAIAINIMNGGLMPRPFINYDKDGDPAKILPFLDKMVDEWLDIVLNKITEELDKYFN